MGDPTIGNVMINTAREVGKPIMREKKARAWDKVTEAYLYSDKFPSMWQFYKELENRGIRHFETEDYTGLQDKNSVEVYEGDKIERNSEIYVVAWHTNKASWYLQPRGGGWHGITRSDMALMCEVIGNIWEELRK